MSHNFEFSYNDIKIKMFLPNDDEYMQEKIKREKNFYEIDLLEEISRLPLEEGVFCDIGACIGNHTLFFSKILGRKVYAFEPVETTYDILLENIRVNSLKDSVITHNVALGGYQATGYMIENEKNIGQAKFVSDPKGSVCVETLDAHLGSEKNVSLIKIDVEGEELSVLEGAKETIKKCRPVIVAEAGSAVSYSSLMSKMSSLEYFPYGKKAITPTYFFVPVEKLEEFSKHHGFLIRNDIDILSRQQAGRFNALGRNFSLDINGLSAVVGNVGESIIKSNEDNSRKFAYFSELAERSQSRYRELLDLLENQSKIIENFQKEINSLVAYEHYNKDLEEKLKEVSISLYKERDRASVLEENLKRLFESGSLALSRKIKGVIGKVNPKVAKDRGWGSYWKGVEKKVRAKHSRESSNYKLMAWSHLSPPKKIRNMSKESVYDSPELSSMGSENRLPKVRVGIVSIKVREKALERTLNSLYHQADEFYVYLNDYDYIPEFLNNKKIIVIANQGDVGDRGKYYGLKDFEGYYFTCDDDILYPDYYVKHCIDGIERYGRKAVVSWHGSIIQSPFEDYYTKTSRRVFSFRSGRPEDTWVHILGTGCAAFHTSTIKVEYDDFTSPNMADVFFAVLGKEQGIPFVVLKHDASEALPIDIPEDAPIHRESIKSTGSKADTKELQNALIKNNEPWVIRKTEAKFERPLMNIGYVGRVDKDRWKKGGILKSGHMLVSTLRRFGHNVAPIEISEGYDEIIKKLELVDVVWIYPGDPERPDFKDVEKIIEACASKGKKVLVNLSYNMMEERSKWIKDKLTVWKRQYDDKVKLLVFTNSIKHSQDFFGVQENVICIPKTIDFELSKNPKSFHETDGIFLGDYQKILNDKLVGGPIEDWIAELREKMPNVELYAVKQYGGPLERDIGINLLPYQEGSEWAETLSSFRVVACLTPHATFEMIPVEASGYGVPIVYRAMPHAHTEVFATAAIEVQNPLQFADACTALYHDKVIWEEYSRNLRLRAYSLHVNNFGASIHQQLVMA